MPEVIDPVDLHVGARVRNRRKLLRMSQQELAAKLGLTFQQVQKYERGTNRISASKLYAIACILKVPVSHLFDDMPAEIAKGSVSESGNGMNGFLRTSEGIELADLFPKVTSAKQRRSIVDLVASMVGEAA